MRLTKEDSPCLDIAVWFALVCEKSKPAAAWLRAYPYAGRWIGVWETAEAWLRDQVDRACATFEGILGYWNKELRGAFVRGKSSNSIVDLLIGPRPTYVRVGAKSGLNL